MIVPCQITQWYLLPAISSELVRELKTLGMKQAEIARFLGVTPAAVSQYIRGKRGRTITFTPEIKKLISKVAKKVANGEINDEELSREICELCIRARKSKILCGLHKDLIGINNECRLCQAV